MQKGKITAIVGESGSGKSTLFPCCSTCIRKKMAVSGSVTMTFNILAMKVYAVTVAAIILHEISSQELSSRIQLKRDQQDQKNAFIYDLEKLVKLDKSGLYMEHVFGTSLYAQQFFSFQSKMQENLFHQQKIKKELDADKELFKVKVSACLTCQ